MELEHGMQAGAEGNQAEGDAVEVVEVEEYGKRNERPPKARKYVIRVDKMRHEWPRPLITGRELLRLAGKDPTRCSVRQKLHGGQAKTIGLDETVNLAEPGIERFMTLCHDQTDG